MEPLVHKVISAPMPKEDNIADVVEVLECRTPQQRNGYDCGVFTLGFAEALSASDDFVKEHHEDILQSHVEENGGQEKFASGLRTQIGDDIRGLAAD